MGAAYFYHLTRSGIDLALARLLERALAQGWRVELRGTEAGRMAALDRALWHVADTGFLPHGLAGSAQDQDQPVLLCVDGQGGDGFDCVMAVDGAGVAADEVQRLQRVCILFDGHDEAALNAARGQWKSLTDAGCAAQYWSEETGRWVKKAEKG